MVLVGRHQAHRLDVAVELGVHARHLKFVVEVGDRAQAPDDHGRAVVGGEFDQQVVEALDADPPGEIVTQRGDFLFHMGNPLVDVEQRPLAGIDRDPDHQAIENLGGPVDNIGMADGDGIESPGVDPDQRACHGFCLPSAPGTADPV